MKTSTHFLQWFIVVLLLAVNAIGLMAAEPSNTGDYSVCQNSTEPYVVTDVASSTFNWEILSGVSGTDWVYTSTSPGHNNTIEVLWKTPGTYTLQVTETNGDDCVGAPKTIQVTVNPLPTATILGSIDVCQTGTAPDVTFTGAGGTAPYTFTYTINNGAAQTVSTTAGNSVTVSQVTGVAGTFAYDLVSVKDASSTTCENPQTGTATITVNPLPTATISGTIDVCQTGTAPDVTFTGAGGTAPYTFTYTINNGAAQTVSTTAGNSVTVSQATGVASTFAYNLVSVKDASSTTCENPQTGTATITVNPLPTVSIASNNGPQCYGEDATFTLTGTPDAVVTYKINAGANQTVILDGTGAATITIANTTASNTLELVSVSNPITSCSQAVIGTSTVTVYPQVKTSPIYHN